MSSRNQHSPKKAVEKPIREGQHPLSKVSGAESSILLKDLGIKFRIITVEELVAFDVSRPDYLKKHFSNQVGALDTLFSECSKVINIKKLRSQLNKPERRFPSGGAALWAGMKLPSAKESA